MKINLKDQRMMPFVMCNVVIINVAVSLDIFPFLKPLSYLILGLCLLSFMVMSYLFLRHPRMSAFDLTITMFLSFFMVFSFLNGTDFKNAIYISVAILLTLFLFKYYSHKTTFLIQSIAFAFSLCIYANLIFMILFTSWIVDASNDMGLFLLGGNYNQIGCRYICCMILNLMCIRYNKWWIVNTILVSLVSIGTLLIVGSMTSLSVIILFTLLIFIPSVKLQKFIFISWFGFYFLFHLFVVFNGEGLHNNELAVYIVEDLLGKDITFTGRTYQWLSALDVIGKSPIWGYGNVDMEWYVSNMSSFAVGPHNFILSILIFGGLILLFLFLAILSLSLLSLLQRPDKTYSILALGIMSLLFMMTFETYPIYFIFLLLIIAFYYPLFIASNPITEKFFPNE